MKEKAPALYIFGGPNGVGKSTFANIILPHFLGIEHFVNADTIARGLSGFAPEKVALEAGKLMLRRLNDLREKRLDFAFESTLASRSFAPYLREAKALGYEVHLYYVWIPSPDISVSRVSYRVSQGGHDVPEEDIRRRYIRSISNMLEMYLPLADYAEIHYNEQNKSYVKVAVKADESLSVKEPELWKSIIATATKNSNNA